MLTLILLASLLASSIAQQYTCNFVMRDPAIPSGFVNGKMTYDYAAGKMLNTYTTTGNNELFEYDAATKAGKYIYKFSTACSCTVGSLSTAMPKLGAASGAQGGAAVTSVAFAGGFPSLLTLTSGRTFSYSGCSATASAAALTPPTNCDCGAPLDVVVVLDRSCSISTANFVNEKQFTLDLVDSFTYSPTQVNLGITNFHVNTWDGPVDIKDGYTEANVLAGANALQCFPDPQCIVSAGSSIGSGTCCGCGTCISCGMINGADMLKAQHARAVAAKSIRVTASKVLIVLTDGYHNKVVSPFLISSTKAPARDGAGKVYGEVHKDKNGVTCNEDQTQTLCVADLNADLQAAVNYAEKAVPGVFIYAIGVGAVYADSQLLIMAQGKKEQVFGTRDWSKLSSLVAGLVQQTCQSVPGTTCDASCCGFCDCKGNCVAPDGCDASNICLKTTITGPCCKSVQLPPPGPSSCAGTDKCYTYDCDPTANGGKGGCTKVLNPVQANTTCAGYTCDPATGNQVYTNLCPCKVACKADADCSGKTACNTVKCVVDATDNCKNHCEITDTSATCNKGDKCYTDSCDPVTGCKHDLNPITPDTKCTTYKCDPATGKVSSTDISSACNKGDKCYTDTCDPVKGCLHVANPVTPNTQCTDYTCDPATGGIVAKDTSGRCNLGDKCFTDSCDPVKGCLHVANPVTPDTQCTTYKCDPKTGSINPTDTSSRCQLGDKCYTDACDPKSGCSHVANPVTPNTKCTTYKCNPATGAIESTDIGAACQKGDKCYTDACDPVTGCSHVANPVTPDTKCTTYKCNPATGAIESTDIGALCQKGDKCYTDACDPVTGCSHVANPIPPNTKCTTYACNPATGTVSSTDIGALCQLGDKCYDDACDPVKGCTHVAKPVPANTKCATFACQSPAGTIKTTFLMACILCDATNMAPCDDKSLCTTDTCKVDPTDPTKNICVNTPLPDDICGKNQTDLCYTYKCDPVKGCTSTKNPVPTSDMCDQYACDPKTGVVGHTTSDCLTNNTDMCKHYSCDRAKGCVFTTTDVPPSDRCVQYACNSKTGAVDRTVSECVANNTNLCKIPSCDPKLGCVYTDVPVPASDACQQYVCNPATGKVESTVATCGANDTSKCNTYTCSKTGGCVKDSVKVPASDACQAFVCNPATGAVDKNATTCDTSNKCKSVTCDVKTGCVYTDVPVPASTACAVYKCDPKTGAVSLTTPDCIGNQTNKCKKGSCDPKLGCVYTDVPVPASDACDKYTCNPSTGLIEKNTTDCAKGNTNKCIQFTCDKKTGCSQKNTTVPASNECNKYVCNPTTGAIDYTNLKCSPPACTIDADCNDKNACTDDSCFWPNKADNKTAVCKFIKKDVSKACNDNNACTIDTCNPKAAPGTDPCNHTALPADFCNDNSACTKDECDPKSTNLTYPCKYTKITCERVDICHNATCDNTRGCQQVPLKCPQSDNCTIAGCNITKNTGCYITQAGNCTPPPVGIAAGLAGGAVAGIVVAAVAAATLFGGGAGYAFTAGAGSGLTATVANNPIYKPSGQSGYNPLHAV